MAGRIRSGYLPTNIPETKTTHGPTISKLHTALLNKLSSQGRPPAKRVLLDKKSKTLPPLDDPDLPPFPEYLPAKQAVTAVVVTWDMQTSSDSRLMGAVDTIGAHCPLEKVDKDGMFVCKIAVQGLPTSHLGSHRQLRSFRGQNKNTYKKCWPPSHRLRVRTVGSAQIQEPIPGPAGDSSGWAPYYLASPVNSQILEFNDNTPRDLLNGEDSYAQWVQNEKQCMESFVKWLASISSQNSGPKGSRDATTDVFRTGNVVLLSFGGISVRIPKLMMALRRHKLMRQFENVVTGLCDVNAESISGDSSAPIGTISRHVLGVDMPETDDPAVQSRHLYRIIAQLFGKKIIRAHLHPLARNTFTPSYVMKLSSWRLKTDHRANDLRCIVTTRVGKGVKRKRSLIKNLLAVGYDYTSLRKQYNALGEFIFREVLLNKLRHMKQSRETSMTDTRDVGCKTVIESVVNHFKEIQKDRLLKRSPPLD